MIRKKQKKLKKQKVVIKKGDRWINEKTGEVIETTEIYKYVEEDFNFHKVWIQDLIRILDLTGSKALKVINYLLGNMRNSDNTVSVTYRQMAEDLNISLFTVTKIMKILQEADFIRKQMNALYMINPDIVVKGNKNKRVSLLIRYIQIPAQKQEQIERKINAKDKTKATQKGSKKAA